MAYTNVDTIRPGFLITSEWLEKERACPHQRGRFKNVFPKGMRITTRNLNLARTKYRLNTRWLIELVLRPYEEFNILKDISGVRAQKAKWTAKDARLLHPAFIKVLKGRD